MADVTFKNAVTATKEVRDTKKVGIRLIQLLKSIKTTAKFMEKTEASIESILDNIRVSASMVKTGNATVRKLRSLADNMEVQATRLEIFDSSFDKGRAQLDGQRRKLEALLRDLSTTPSLAKLHAGKVAELEALYESISYTVNRFKDLDIREVVKAIKKMHKAIEDKVTVSGAPGDLVVATTAAAGSYALLRASKSAAKALAAKQNTLTGQLALAAKQAIGVSTKASRNMQALHIGSVITLVAAGLLALIVIIKGLMFMYSAIVAVIRKTPKEVATKILKVTNVPD